ncbi:AraC-like DNA-binding protein [Anaerobacterium chartisolvens]|uniref:AraC-like DNA-binding protein n=1 Tax=Anaerobacterium chartisolvens TaxID=1297424 RepID=A0A369AZ78_9FIRM|nr:AraC family transcriptional regulator [Anaerobacterium chartisolvens]RCX13486.1 AraC-like DNA-binding protein [Anaerobacterium chartisolvens]
MLEKIYINHPDYTDLNMYRCGIEDCKPGHSWGPALRDHFLIHYILEGKGSFQLGPNTYYLEKGQGFLMPPNVIAHYRADEEAPWSYGWVGFHGIKAEAYLRRAGLSAHSPIFTCAGYDFMKDCLMRMIATKNLARGREIRLLGLLYIFLSQLIEVSPQRRDIDKNENKREGYIKKAVEFIAMNYWGELSIHEMAHYVGLDRSYLYSIFKENLNMSPQEFLISYRIEKACELMENHDLSIGDISRSVGYNDPLLFSKTFKKIKGMSPRQYRNER